MAEINSTYILEKLNAHFGEGIILHSEEPYNFLTITAKSEFNIEILKFLFNDADLRVQFMTDLTVVHYPEKKQDFVVVYHLHSLENNYRLRLKFPLSKASLHIKTATAVFATANWLEREAYDFFGVDFVGHPDLRRILNVDHMEAFPLRKEFPLEDPNRIDKKDSFFGR